MSDFGDKEYYHSKRNTGKDKKRRNHDYNGKYSARHVRDQGEVALKSKEKRSEIYRKMK